MYSSHVVLCDTQVQPWAGLAAAVALLWPVSSQPVSSETHSAFSWVAAQRAPGLGLPAAAAELSEVRSTHCITHHHWHRETELSSMFKKNCAWDEKRVMKSSAPPLFHKNNKWVCTKSSRFIRRAAVEKHSFNTASCHHDVTWHHDWCGDRRKCQAALPCVFMRFIKAKLLELMHSAVHGLVFLYSVTSWAVYGSNRWRQFLHSQSSMCHITFTVCWPQWLHLHGLLFMIYIQHRWHYNSLFLMCAVGVCGVCFCMPVVCTELVTKCQNNEVKQNMSAIVQDGAQEAAATPGGVRCHPTEQHPDLP